MKFDREKGEHLAVMAMLHTVAGRIFMREIVAELMIVPTDTDTGAVNRSNGRRSLAREIAELAAEADVRAPGPESSPVDAADALSVARAGRARTGPVGGGTRSRRTRRFAGSDGSGD